MSITVKSILRHSLQHTPYRITRAGAGNGFQAIDDLLGNLSTRGYQPAHIIDGGAITGEFSKLARKTWHTAHIDMIEPQLSCRAALDALARHGRCSVHACAIGDQTGTVRLAADPARISTGAHVVEAPAEPGSTSARAIETPVLTLDDIMGAALPTSGSCLLKLDLQGYELHALRGAMLVLPRIDAVLTEVSFYAQAYEPPISVLTSFLDKQGFELHDIAALAARRRDGRAHQGDFLFVRRGSLLARDTAWS